jgi:16S rRNA (guanine527-N7)-methyltransferase
LSGPGNGPDAALAAILESLRDPRAPVSPGSVADADRVHIADSLSGLEFAELAEAGRIADIGSGAGLPGLVLAASLPDARVDLIESVGRKCEFARAAIDRAGLGNAEVVCERAEAWSAGEGREAYDAVTARAIGRLATVAELASPLLQPGGFLVAWEGRRDPGQEAELDRAAPNLAMEVTEIRPVRPYEGSRDRHIHLLRKNGPTPKELPRRDGLAAKRPFGSE